MKKNGMLILNICIHIFLILDISASIKNQYLLYIKKSEEISKFLAYVEATEAVFEFENSRIDWQDHFLSMAEGEA